MSRLEKCKAFPFVIPGSVVTELNTAGFGNTFPYDTAHFKWSEDNFGPLWVPEKGETLFSLHLKILLFTGGSSGV